MLARPLPSAKPSAGLAQALRRIALKTFALHPEPCEALALYTAEDVEQELWAYLASRAARLQEELYTRAAAERARDLIAQGQRQATAVPASCELLDVAPDPERCFLGPGWPPWTLSDEPCCGPADLARELSIVMLAQDLYGQWIAYNRCQAGPGKTARQNHSGYNFGNRTVLYIVKV